MVSLKIRGNKLAETISFNVNADTLFTFWQIYLDEMYHVSLQGRPKTVVDLGANIGLASRWFLEQYPGARLIAVEPEPANLTLLQRNLRGIPNVDIVPFCVYSCDGDVYLRVSKHSDRHAVVPSKGESTIRVPCISMDTLLTRYQISHIDLLKVDIEGAEAVLLKHCASWIKKVGCMIIEVHRQALSAEELEEIIKPYGFAVCRSPGFRHNRIIICVNNALIDH